MELNTIVKFVNEKLNGETLSYNDMLIHLDSCIDDINEKLSAKFPVFSEFSPAAHPESYPNYNFIPDKYIRSVVIKGVATKFYTTDEEGIDSAQQYSREYNTALFLLQRDFSNRVPAEYQDYEQGFLIADEKEKLDFDREATGGANLIW